MHDKELRQKEDSMMLRIREAESTQAVGDLRQKIAELEVQNQELITRGQIMDDKDLQEKLVELQDEVMRLRLLQTLYRRQSISTDPTRIDYEESEDESIISPSSPLSPLLSSQEQRHRLSSSTVIFPSSFVAPSHRLRQSTPSLFHSAVNSKMHCTTSSTTHSISQPSSSSTS